MLLLQYPLPGRYYGLWLEELNDCGVVALKSISQFLLEFFTRIHLLRLAAPPPRRTYLGCGKIGL